MSEVDVQDRTEQPTPKRLEDARKRGQVPRSVDLSAAAVTLAAAGVLYGFGGAMAGGYAALMRDGLSVSRAQIDDEAAALNAFRDLMMEGLLIASPVLGTVLVAALVAPLAIGGWNFSGEALIPRLERISPIAGFRRIFSVRSAVELAKAIAKFLIVATIAVIVLWSQSEEFLALAGASPVAASAAALKLCAEALLFMALGLCLIALLDVPYQFWQHTRELRMTRQEVRDEFKETEGSPEVRGRIRAIQMAVARRRMMQEIPTASVVITNPTHYAVALRYEDGRNRAPIVVAKGVDEVAARIREVAAAHDVPVFEAPPLARALYRSVELGREIPAALYVAVAQVLTYVYQLRAARSDGRAAPERPEIDPAVETVGTRGRA